MPSLDSRVPAVLLRSTGIRFTTERWAPYAPSAGPESTCTWSPRRRKPGRALPLSPRDASAGRTDAWTWRRFSDCSWTWPTSSTSPAVLIAMDDRERDRRGPAARAADRAVICFLTSRQDSPSGSPTRRSWWSLPGSRHPAPADGDPRQRGGGGAAAWPLGLPVVAKWSSPWLLPAGAGLRSTQVLRSAQEARALCRRGEEAGSRLLLQAFLPPAAATSTGSSTATRDAAAVCGRRRRTASSAPGRAGRASPRWADGCRTPTWRAGRTADRLGPRLPRHPRPRLPPGRRHRRVPPARLQPPARRAVPALHRRRGDWTSYARCTWT